MFRDVTFYKHGRKQNEYVDLSEKNYWENNRNWVEALTSQHMRACVRAHTHTFFHKRRLKLIHKVVGKGKEVTKDSMLPISVVLKLLGSVFL